MHLKISKRFKHVIARLVSDAELRTLKEMRRRQIPDVYAGPHLARGYFPRLHLRDCGGFGSLQLQRGCEARMRHAIIAA